MIGDNEIDGIVDNAIQACKDSILELQRVYEAAEAAAATLDLTADAVLTSVALGVARNDETFTLEVVAPAANPTDTLLAAWSGTADALVLTITPNDGTNNTATPVTMTTAELVEYLNTGDIAAKTGQVTESGANAAAFRALQTATGGGATPLADSGEGDGEVGTFSGGVDAYSIGDKWLDAAAVGIKADLKD